MGMRTLYAFLLFIFFAARPVFAQDQAPNVDQMVAKMQSALNLTADQVSAIQPIIEKYISKREELKQGVEDGTIERSDMRSQMKDLRDSEKQELSQILSADQISQWEQMQKRAHKQWNQNQAGGNNADAPSNHGGDNS